MTRKRSQKFAELEIRMAQALDAIKKKEVKSINAASKVYDIPYMTLSRRVNGGLSNAENHESSQLLSHAEENMLQLWCSRLTAGGRPIPHRVIPIATLIFATITIITITPAADTFAANTLVAATLAAVTLIVNSSNENPTMDTITNTSTYRSKYGETPKLITMNYHSWSTSVTYILRAAQAWQIVTGEEQPPKAPAANTNATARDRYEDKRDRYNSRLDIAAATILL
ncbi:MAG: hypothetical protein M1840_002376 [Geoglossum simile]|nr:MAG: hypothetical protein M1840_002376 [Geoglossum simile]